jgi:hypothetical protein
MIVSHMYSDRLSFTHKMDDDWAIRQKLAKQIEELQREVFAKDIE